VFTEPLSSNGLFPVATGMRAIASRCSAMDYSGFQASYHNILALSYSSYSCTAYEVLKYGSFCMILFEDTEELEVLLSL
jgi:hypothetical protein